MAIWFARFLCNTVEVELKIKTTQGKYTFNKDTCTRTDRYHPWDRVVRRPKIHTKNRRTNRKEDIMDTTESTNSETDMEKVLLMHLKSLLTLTMPQLYH